MMKILIFGATGFIGSDLTQQLSLNNKVAVVTRSYRKAKSLFSDEIEIFDWDYQDVSMLSEIISGFDVIINLAGENIASKLWTRKQKDKIVNSRLKVGEQITKAMMDSNKPPHTLVQASAVGYYGYNAPQECDENSPKGEGFLAEVTAQWENSTAGVSDHGVRRIILRTGLVLGSDGGIFPQLVKPIKLFVGANFGKGKNYLSWIHQKDEINAIQFLINNKTSVGIYNLAAPNPVYSRELNQMIAKKLNRPLWLNIPRFILVALLGDMAKGLLMASQRVVPEKLIKEGFTFKYSNLESAVDSLLK